MSTYKDVPPEKWDREARALGRLAMIEHTIGALIIASGHGEAIREAIEMKLDLMFGRNPPGQLNDKTQEIAFGADETAQYFLKACDVAKAGE